MKKLFRYIFLKFVEILPPCQRIVKNIDTSLVDKIGFWDKLLIRMHLVTCPWCTRYHQQTHIIENALSDLSEKQESLPLEKREMSQERRQNIQQRILEELKNKNS